MKRLFLVLAATLPAGQAASPHLADIMPRGAQRGTEITLTLTGKRLGGALELLSYTSGFDVHEIRNENDDKVVAKVRVPGEIALGEHQFRLRTATGISELRTFWVGQFPTVDEKEPNNTIEKSQPTSPGNTIAGEVQGPDKDLFTLSLKQGQRISAEIEGMRLGQVAFDPYLAVLDTGETVLISSDDTPLLGQDPYLTFIAPADGDYFLEVRESTRNAPARSRYRLHIGNFPRPPIPFPLGGETGKTLRISYPGTTPRLPDQEIELPPQAIKKFPFHAKLNGLLAPSPNYLRVSPFPNHTETEPNDDRKHPEKTSPPLPVAFNGSFEKPDDTDWFQFSCKKGETFLFEVFAQQLGSPADCVIAIHHATDGKHIGSNDDRTAGTHDASYKFKAPVDGEYLLAVREHLNRCGAEYVYRVEAAPLVPELVASIPQFVRNDTQPRQMIPVPRGGHYATLINIERRHVSGEVTLQAQDLPTGVSMQATTFPKGTNQQPVVFSATADAEISGRLCPLEPAGENIRGHFYQKLEMPRNDANLRPWRLVENDRIPVVVTEELPFKIELVAPDAPIVRDGILDLKVIAHRAEDFDAPITVRMLWKPPGIGTSNTLKIPSGKKEILYPINANNKAALGGWKLAVLGEANTGKGLMLSSSTLEEITVEEPFLSMVIAMGAVRRGHTLNLVATVEQLRPFEGEAVVELHGLPAHTTTEKNTISSSSKKVIFPITTTGKSPLGKHKNLYCRVSVPVGGSRVIHTVARGSILRIDNPDKATGAVAKK